MIYRPQTINFREALAGDTFDCKLTIHPLYQIRPDTRVVLSVMVSTDADPDPIFICTTEEDITIDGQTLVFSKQLPMKKGRFYHTMQFTTDNVTVTLYRGLFEII